MGLPRAYTPELFDQKTTAVFQHVYDAYYGAGHSVYAMALQDTVYMQWHEEGFKLGIRGFSSLNPHIHPIQQSRHDSQGNGSSIPVRCMQLRRIIKPMIPG